jgi:cytochrome c oxidase assembly protein subunit 15
MATTTKPATQRGFSDILALGFGTTVGMWTLAYLLRLPAVHTPAPYVTGGLCVMLALGGYFAGRYTRRGFIAGLLTGLLSGALNLLIVLSAISERFQPGAANAINPAEFIGIALATVAMSAVICGLGAAFGNTRRARNAELPNWTAVFSKVAVGATFLLLIAGGLVTSNQAGLAVPDWPNSFGHNMFLLPLSEMDNAPVFLEHAHRLLGALVGLTVLTLAIHLSLVPVATKVRITAWLAFLLVAAQGILGGLRVVEKAAAIGAVHGVLAQLIFGLIVGVAVATSTIWRDTTVVKRYASANTDRILPIVTLVALVIQIAIGADIRHLNHADQLMTHITVAALFLALAVTTGVRAWGQHPELRMIRRRGVGLIHLTIVQVLLGIVALMAGALNTAQPSFGQAVLFTLHQAFGALLLAWAVNVMLWNRKVLQPVIALSDRAAA